MIKYGYSACIVAKVVSFVNKFLSKRYGILNMYNVNHFSICKYINRIQLFLEMYGCATVSSDWKGTILNPLSSRLYYIKSGSAVITTADNVRYTLSTGRWYLLPARCSFEYECEEAMEHIYFHLKLCDFDEIDLLSSAEEPLSLSLPAEYSDRFAACIGSDNILSGLNVKQTVYGILLQFVEYYRLSVERSDYSQCIYRALRYIKQNLSVKLSISEIAENVFVSKSTLTKHFQKELGMSVNQYVTDTVMSEAGRLLLSGNMSVLTISEKLGFSDQFYFSRRFKEKYGVSPRDYRKNSF